MGALLWNSGITGYPLLAALIFALPSAGVGATVNLPFASVQSSNGTDNTFQTLVADGNWLDPDFSTPSLPSSWGTPAGAVFLGAGGGRGAFWMQNQSTGSPNGYLFNGSFLIASAEGLEDGLDATLFVSKPTDWSGDLAAWRLYYIKDSDGSLVLMFIVGWNSETNNPSAAIYRMPVNAGQAYNVAIDYDTADRFYSLSLDGVVEVASTMPSDYPLIGTEIIGSSGSADGHDTAFIVDNVSWDELPGAAVPEPGSWLLLCSGFLVLACARAHARILLRAKPVV
jgi:hypothetical protein